MPLLLLLAFRDSPTTALQADRGGGLTDPPGRGEDSSISYAEYAIAVLHNGLGRYQLAMAAAQRSNDHHPREQGGAAQVELVEAAVRCGAPDVAATALAYLRQRTRSAGTDWALGLEARSSGASSRFGERAEPLYREALDRFDRTPARVDLARAHLVYGEWLRRGAPPGRRARAAALGARALRGDRRSPVRRTRCPRAARDGREGAHPQRRDARCPTAQEIQVARHARDGLSNPEIGARLFISRRTVEYHLHKVFAKLEISRPSSPACSRIAWTGTPSGLPADRSEGRGSTAGITTGASGWGVTNASDRLTADTRGMETTSWRHRA